MPKKKDSNQPQIEQDLRDVGATVFSVHIVPNLFDMIVIFRGTVYLAEIKNPEYLPKRNPDPRQMLTTGELEAAQLVEAAGGVYHIWLDSDQAMRAIGAIA